MNQKDIGSLRRNMLLRGGKERKARALSRGTKLGGMHLVARDPSYDRIPAPDGKVTRMAAHDGSLPETAWSKDIRAYYNAVMLEPMPQEFLDLLARIAPDISA